MMIPFVFTIALSFISFLASAFVILRIVIPILPPHPLSRRVAPSEFGLPNYNFRSLSPADKTHLWLASLDLLALCVFIWQAASEYSGGATGFADARDIAASARLWFALTIRQTCLLVISGLTLIHIRIGCSVSFGRKHWMIWVPTLFLVSISTTLAAILAGAGVRSLFTGAVAYSATTSVLSSAALGGLVYTLFVIKRNLAALDELTDAWPPVKEVEEKRRPSFATEDIDGLREGSSWLTSDAGSSRRESVSNWSFSTHHTRQGSMRSMRLSPAAPQPSVQSKLPYWFDKSSSGTDPIPPVPPLPSVYRGGTLPTSTVANDHDPFRRAIPSRPRLGSQSSWLASPSVSQVTLSAWSYTTSPIVDTNNGHALPTTPLGGSVLDANIALLPNVVPSRPATPMASVADLNAGLLPQGAPSRPPTPALSSARVLGGYGYTADSEKGIVSLAATGGEVDISYSRYALWLFSIWFPFALSLPYLVSITGPQRTAFVDGVSIMLVLSVTLSSPLLALNILVRSPIPIPYGLFDVHAEPPSVVMRAPSPTATLSTFCREYKKSASVITLVDGRRSGDVWISQGNAVDGKGKLGRALGLITPLPRLAVLPPKEEQRDGEITPPLPMQEDTFNATASPTPQSTNSAELGRLRKESKASSHFSGDETFATRIMIAQRHYSAVATTVVVPASPERAETPDGLLSMATGVHAVPTINPTSSHLRSRSVSSVIDQTAMTADISVPPSQPLPPTPPNIRHAKQTAKQLLHRRSRSSDFSFGAAVDDKIKEIDALTAGVLPLLVPGLKLGEEIKIRDWEEFSPPFSSTVTKTNLGAVTQASARLEFGVLSQEGFASPQLHSTPAQGRQSLKGKVSRHKRNHLSLPSFGLGEDGGHWKEELNQVLDTQIERGGLPAGDPNRRNAVRADEVVSNVVAHPVAESRAQRHAPMTGGSLGCSTPVRNTGLQVEIPRTVNSARTSLATLIPPSAASTVTLFEAGGVFGPVAQSTPCDAQKKHQVTETTATPDSRRSSIVYIKSDEAVTCVDCNTLQMTLAPPAVKPIVPKTSTLQRKSTMSRERLTTPSGGLRPLSLLRDRDMNKEGNALKPTGTRPLVFGKKKQKLEVMRDENADPSSGNKYLKPLQLGRSDSSKIRGILRRDEVLPTVIVRPPSTNARTGSHYEYH